MCHRASLDLAETRKSAADKFLPKTRGAVVSECGTVTLLGILVAQASRSVKLKNVASLPSLIVPDRAISFYALCPPFWS
jgi:hypothetical protein